MRHSRDLPAVSDPHIKYMKSSSGCWHLCLAQWQLCHVYYVGHVFLIWIYPPLHPSLTSTSTLCVCLRANKTIFQIIKKRKYPSIFQISLHCAISFFIPLTLLLLPQICLSDAAVIECVSKKKKKKITQGRDECVAYGELVESLLNLRKLYDSGHSQFIPTFLVRITHFRHLFKA